MKKSKEMNIKILVTDAGGVYQYIRSVLVLCDDTVQRNEFVTR